jgi:hypothetical protein
MSLSNPEAFGCLAMAQGLMVLPALGDSYEGKSAAAIAGLLVALTMGEDLRMARRLALRAELEATLGIAPAGPDTGWQTGMDALMAALDNALQAAEADDGDRAARLLDWLLRWTANERLELPQPEPVQPPPA